MTDNVRPTLQVPARTDNEFADMLHRMQSEERNDQVTDAEIQAGLATEFQIAEHVTMMIDRYSEYLGFTIVPTPEIRVRFRRIAETDDADLEVELYEEIDALIALQIDRASALSRSHAVQNLSALPEPGPGAEPLVYPVTPHPMYPQTLASLGIVSDEVDGPEDVPNGRPDTRERSHTMHGYQGASR